MIYRDDSNSCGSVRHVDEACSHRRRRGIRAVRTASFHVPNCARLCNSPKVNRSVVESIAYDQKGVRYLSARTAGYSAFAPSPALRSPGSPFPCRTIPHSPFRIQCVPASPTLRFSLSPFPRFSAYRCLHRVSALGSRFCVVIPHSSFRIPHSARLPACSPASLKRDASALPPQKPPGPLKTLKQLIRSERKNESVPLLCYSKNHAETASPRNQPLPAGPRHAPHNVPHDRVYVHGH